MRTERIILIAMTAIILGGCFGFKPFQPPPYAYENWDKPGATEAEVDEALLECGVNPIMDKRYPFTLNEVALAALCMEADGFIWKLSRPWRDSICFDGAPACRPGTPAPHRDPDKRISSAYCHDFPRARGCQP